MLTVLIKLRPIGLLLFLVVNTSAFGQTFGQHYNQMSLPELQQELTRVTDIVYNDEVWLFPTTGSDIPLVLPREEGIALSLDARTNLTGRTLSKNEVFDTIDYLRDYSDGIKQQMRNTSIPQLTEYIKHHPDNPNNPLNPYDPNVDPYEPGPEPSGATHCHSIGPNGKGFMVGDKQLGSHCMYHQNGRLSQEMPYAHGKKHGTARNYYDNGEKSAEYPYWNGKKNGQQLSWYRNGNLKGRHYFEDNQLHGEARTYYEDGRPTACWLYDHGRRISRCPL